MSAIDDTVQQLDLLTKGLGKAESGVTAIADVLADPSVTVPPLPELAASIARSLAQCASLHAALAKLDDVLWARTPSRDDAKTL